MCTGDPKALRSVLASLLTFTYSGGLLSPPVKAQQHLPVEGCENLCSRRRIEARKTFMKANDKKNLWSGGNSL